MTAVTNCDHLTGIKTNNLAKIRYSHKVRLILHPLWSYTHNLVTLFLLQVHSLPFSTKPCGLDFEPCHTTSIGSSCLLVSDWVWLMRCIKRRTKGPTYSCLTSFPSGRCWLALSPFLYLIKSTCSVCLDLS